METAKLIFFILFVVLIIYLSKKQKQDEYLAQVRENEEFKIGCNKDSNRRLLKLFGEETFKQMYGSDILNQIKNNTDTISVHDIKRGENNEQY